MVFKITGNLKSSNNPKVVIGKPLDLKINLSQFRRALCWLFGVKNLHPLSIFGYIWGTDLFMLFLINLLTIQFFLHPGDDFAVKWFLMDYVYFGYLYVTINFF